MKYVICILSFLLILNFKIEAKESFSIDMTFLTDAGKVNVMEFGEVLTVRNTAGSASWKDSNGDYGVLKCLGNYISYKKQGTELKLYCKGMNKDDDILWFTMKRKSTELDAGIGKSEYIYGEGKFKNYIGVQCVYAVEISKEFSILKHNCKSKKNKK